MELEQEDIVLCTVERIIGTTVFVKIHTSEGELEGTITTSEIAPGRIRNLREYVVPKKQIVCKILRISGNQINLSLRRVTQKEKKEVLEKQKQEKSYESILKTILKEKAPETLKKIKSKLTLYNIIESAKENPKELEKFISKKDAEKILEIIKTQKEKIISIKKIIQLTTTESEGLDKIKKILKTSEKDKIKIKYISGGKYSIAKESEDAKKVNQELNSYIEELEKSSKENHLNFAIIEK